MRAFFPAALFVLALALLQVMFSSSTILAGGDLAVTGAALAKCDRSTIVDPQYPTTGQFSSVNCVHQLLTPRTGKSKYLGISVESDVSLMGP